MNFYATLTSLADRLSKCAGQLHTAIVRRKVKLSMLVELETDLDEAQQELQRLKTGLGKQ